jgi:hypothetical protein
MRSGNNFSCEKNVCIETDAFIIICSRFFTILIDEIIITIFNNFTKSKFVIQFFFIQLINRAVECFEET